MPDRTALVLFAWAVRALADPAGSTDATCTFPNNGYGSFNWTINGAGQSPCLVAAELLSACSGDPVTIPALSSDSSWVAETNSGDSYSYYVPPSSEATECACSSTVYSLLSACSYCQDGSGTSPWSVPSGYASRWTPYVAYCSNPTTSRFPKPIPLGVAVPAWASIAPVTGVNNDGVWWDWEASRTVAINGVPDTVGTAPKTSSTTSTEPSSTPSPTASDSRSSGATNVGAILGGALAGAGAVAIIAAVAGCCWLRRRRRRADREGEPVQRLHSSVELDDGLSPYTDGGHEHEARMVGQAWTPLGSPEDQVSSAPQNNSGHFHDDLPPPEYTPPSSTSLSGASSNHLTSTHSGAPVRGKAGLYRG